MNLHDTAIQSVVGPDFGQAGHWSAGGPVEFLNVDPETGDVCMMVWDGESAREVHASEMFADLVELGFACDVGSAVVRYEDQAGAEPSLGRTDLVHASDELSEFIAKYEHAYPRDA